MREDRRQRLHDWRDGPENFAFLATGDDDEKPRAWNPKTGEWEELVGRRWLAFEQMCGQLLVIVGVVVAVAIVLGVLP